MRYFTINTNGAGSGGDYCFTDQTPDGVTGWYRFLKGDPFGEKAPASGDEVTLRLAADAPGLKLPSLIGNTINMLPVDTKAAATILAHHVGRVEQLPFLLIDHKGRVYSRDYAILHPLERVECLNMDASQVRRSYKGEIKEVTRVVLDRTKEDALFDLCRLGEEPSVYLFSETLVEALEKIGATNFRFQPVESQ
jgi:hypothetical protein